MDGKWYIPVSLFANVLILSILACFFFIDGYTMIGKFPMLLGNLERQLFSLSRIGINLAICITWNELRCQTEGGKIEIKWTKRILQLGFLTFCLLEIPVSMLLLTRKFSVQFIQLVPAMVLVCELCVGSYFAISGVMLLRELGQVNSQTQSESLRLSKNQAVMRAARLIFVSGINSLVNIVTLCILSTNLERYRSDVWMYLALSGFLVYCRLLDAFLQILILKPASQQLVPEGIQTGMLSATQRTFKLALKTKTKASSLAVGSRKSVHKVSAVESCQDSDRPAAPLVKSQGWQTAFLD